MKDHMPSELIPLHEGMIISFVNYELRVRFQQKTDVEIKEQTILSKQYFKNIDEDNKKLGLRPIASTQKLPIDEIQQLSSKKPSFVVLAANDH